MEIEGEYGLQLPSNKHLIYTHGQQQQQLHSIFIPIYYNSSCGGGGNANKCVHVMRKIEFCLLVKV